MAHSSEADWTTEASKVSQIAQGVIEHLNLAEETYQNLLEIYNYAGGTDQLAADLLFQTAPGTADAAQVAKVTDLRLCIVALHEMWQAMNNTAVAQADRAAVLRRMG